MTLQLTSDERALLAEILGEAWLELREEIYKTDRFAYKQELKLRERTLSQLLDRINRLAIA